MIFSQNLCFELSTKQQNLLTYTKPLNKKMAALVCILETEYRNRVKNDNKRTKESHRTGIVTFAQTQNICVKIHLVYHISF